MDKDVVDVPLLDKVVVGEGEVKERWMDGCCVVTVPVDCLDVCLVTQTAVAATFGSEWSRPEQSWPFGFCSIKW